MSTTTETKLPAFISIHDQRAHYLGRMLGTLEIILPRITDDRDREQVERLLSDFYRAWPQHAPNHQPKE